MNMNEGQWVQKCQQWGSSYCKLSVKTNSPGSLVLFLIWLYHIILLQIWLTIYVIMSNRADKARMLLVIRSISWLVRVVRPWHLSLWWWPLHTGWMGATGIGPHPWAHGAWLGERRAKSALVLWNWVWIVVVRTDRGNGTRWRVTHVGWQLADDVSGWRWRWHWRCLVVNHVRCSWALRRVLHGDAERGRRRPVMWLLWWRHDMMWEGHHWLAGVIARVMVWRRAGRGLWVWLMGGGAWAPRVIMNGHRDEVAMLTCSHCGNSEGLWGEGPWGGSQIRGRGWKWMVVGIVALQWGRNERVCFSQVRRRWKPEAIWRVGGQSRVWPIQARGSSLADSHVAMFDVGLQVSLWEVGAIAALHDAAHEEGAALALLDALDWVWAAVEGQTELKI